MPAQRTGLETLTVLHPTILIGYGRYGLRVMQAMLSSAAARGILSWEESTGIAIMNERKLRTLALFWIPDLLDIESESVAEEASGDNFEMMQDLYQQIDRLPATGPNPGQMLAERVEEAKRRLFSEPLLTQARDQIGIGLDVILVAQPTHEMVIGKLRQVMAPVLARLGGDPGLTSPRGGQDLLNLIQVLDFENFWDPSPSQSALRDALAQGLETDGRDVSGRPAFGRIYLFDGRTERGNQEEGFRRQQTVLFLEFLVFDGHRSSVDLRMFYQREQRDVPAVCVVGVRGVEHSTALMRRIAAAVFARGWLEYLGGRGSTESAPALAGVLEPFSADRIDATIGVPAVETLIGDALRAMESELLQIDLEQENWPAMVSSACERLVGVWQQRLQQASDAAGGEALRQRLKMLHPELVAAAGKALTSQDMPVTVGALLEEIERATGAIELLPAEGQPRPPLENCPPSFLSDVHTNYLTAREGQVQPARLRNRWWPLAAIGAAAALLPLALEAVEGLIGGAMPLWTEVALLSAGLTASFWAGGAAVFHPLIAGRVERALNFHTDRERGRLVSAIRRLLKSNVVEGRLRATTDRALRAQRLRVIREVAGALERLRAPLDKRKHEMEWLHQQLHDYLNLHGVDGRGPAVRFLPNRKQNQVLHSIESEQDLQAIVDRRPRNPSEYRAQQRQLQVFEGWEQAYCLTFLEPHLFLDRLAESFPVPEWKEDGAAVERWAHDITGALHSTGPFPPSFYWLKADGLPAQLGYCSLPSHWLRLRDVEAELLGLGYREHTVKRSGGERLYLLQARMGVPAHLLGRNA